MILDDVNIEYFVMEITAIPKTYGLTLYLSFSLDSDFNGLTRIKYNTLYSGKYLHFASVLQIFAVFRHCKRQTSK